MFRDRAGVQFALLAFSSLFSVINPISAAPIFVALTVGDTPGNRRRTALRACIAAALVLAVFGVAGGAIFSFFQITVPAFQIAGGILFTIMSLREMEDTDRGVTPADAEKLDPSVVPIGIPLIAGPGAISAMMVLVGQAVDAPHRVGLAVAMGASIAITLVTLLAAPAIVARIGLTGQRVVAKIMGLVTAVIGVQFILNGATTVILEILRQAKQG
jgi:multiple antibiotic resistance protein